jgi:hypothetical protein
MEGAKAQPLLQTSTFAHFFFFFFLFHNNRRIIFFASPELLT